MLVYMYTYIHIFLPSFVYRCFCDVILFLENNSIFPLLIFYRCFWQYSVNSPSLHGAILDYFGAYFGIFFSIS